MPEAVMNTPKYIAGLVAISMVVLSARSAFVWDTRWQFKEEAPSSNYIAATQAVEMREKLDHNSMNTFQGATDSSNGYTVMRNLNGGTMRGYINQDGSGLLRGQNGNFYNVNARWMP
jgi:hypothetical protein